MITAKEYIVHKHHFHVYDAFQVFNAFLNEKLSSSFSNGKLKISNKQGDFSEFEFVKPEEGNYNGVVPDSSPDYLTLHVHFVMWWGLMTYDEMSFQKYLDSGWADNSLSIEENWDIYKGNTEDVMKIHKLLGNDDFEEAKKLYIETVP